MLPENCKVSYCMIIYLFLLYLNSEPFYVDNWSELNQLQKQLIQRFL